MEKSYLQLLIERFLPAIMAGLQQDLAQAPENSEEKLAILRVMRMLEDKAAVMMRLSKITCANAGAVSLPGKTKFSHN